MNEENNIISLTFLFQPVVHVFRILKAIYLHLSFHQNFPFYHIGWSLEKIKNTLVLNELLWLKVKISPAMMPMLNDIRKNKTHFLKKSTQGQFH